MPVSAFVPLCRKVEQQRLTADCMTSESLCDPIARDSEKKKKSRLSANICTAKSGRDEGEKERRTDWQDK